MCQIDTVILCGGESRRMGMDKALLKIGEESFLERLIREFSKQSQVFLSLGEGREYDFVEKTGSPVSYIRDLYPNCGPLGALHAICSSISTEWFFVVTVDLPFADIFLKEDLQSYLSNGIDAVIPIAEDGRVHPLCAFYRRDLVEKLEYQLEKKKYRVQDFLKSIRVSYVPMKKLPFSDRKLSNINTREDYEERVLKRSQSILRNRYAIPIVSVAAYSGSGKTTFLEKLIWELRKRGLRIAVLKHDGHDFSLDQEGKDTWRFAKAGASPVLIASDTKLGKFIYEGVVPERLLDEISGVDMILIEGYKKRDYPKILLHRKAAGKELAMDLEEERPLFIVSDDESLRNADCEVLGLEETSEVATLLIEKCDLDILP